MAVDLDFESFFRTEHPRVVALGIAMVGDREVAVDLAQEAFLRAYRDWERVSAYDAPAAWVRRVLVNLANDRGRRSLSERRALARLDARHATYEDPEPFDEAWRSVVQQLPPRQRAVVALYYLDDSSVAEIAEVLRLREGTVKATLANARATLRQRMIERMP